MPVSTQRVAEPVGHRPGTSGYRRIVVALFAAGVATFTLLYSTQALLPVDLNSLLAHMEQTLSVGYGLKGDARLSKAYAGRAQVQVVACPGRQGGVHGTADEAPGKDERVQPVPGGGRQEAGGTRFVQGIDRVRQTGQRRLTLARPANLPSLRKPHALTFTDQSSTYPGAKPARSGQGSVDRR